MMNKLLISLLLLAAKTVGAQEADPLEKNWYNADSSYVISFMQDDADDMFYGKIVWLKQPTNADGSIRTDVKNKDASFHQVPLKNMVIIGNLRKHFNFQDKYENGSIYNPETGKMQCIDITQVSYRRLQVFVYACQLGMLGKYVTWTLAE